VTRRLRTPFIALAVVATTTLTAGILAPLGSSPAAAAPADPNGVVAVVIEGQGNGHGRGLSQWGSYGWATTQAKDWRWILDFYYGGTVMASAPAGQRITVSLSALNGAQTAVIAADGNGQFNGAGAYRSMVAREVSGNDGTYDVWAASNAICPAAGDSLSGWAYLGRVSAGTGQSAVRFSVPNGDDPNSAVGSLLGVCEPSGAVRHYRGSIYATNGSAGEDRTVNDVDVEAYLRGVVPRESPASWGDATGGAGINALRAQAVAARSYALAQGGSYGGRRYTFAKTCDTQSCQVYGGAGTRPSATGSVTVIEDARTDRAIVDTAGLVRERPGAPGVPVSTEFSSSNGDRTAGGAFTSVDDPGDMIDANPWNRWTRVLDASALAGRYGLSSITGASNENDPLSVNRGWQGMWALQTRLMSGSSSTVVSHATLRSAYDLPSIAFTVRVVKRDVVLPDDFLFIGDSVGESIAARSQSGELPSLLSGVFASTYYDALTNRCTVGACVANQFDGLGVAQNAPGTPDIAVVALGYNDSGSAMAGEIDQVMTALVNRGVRLVGWVNLSQRRTSGGSPTYGRHNEALRSATAKWPQLRVLDWNGASSLGLQSRWYSDGVHLTTTGQAQYALWLRDRIIEMVAGIEQTRVFGDDRYLTAIQISSQARSAGAITGGEVVIVNGTGTVDGLAAAGFAGARRVAILLTRADALPGDVAAHLQSLNPSRVTVVGGVNAVMPAVLDQIRALAPAAVVERVEGADRYLTAQALARTVLADAPVLYIASGQSQVDALSIAPAAYAQADPLLLSTPLGLDDTTQVAVREWWAANPTGRVVIVGGTSAIGSGLEKQLLFFGIPANKTTRLNGKDRYETSSAAVAWVRSNVTGFASGSIGFASGQSPIDSLTSSPLLAGGAVRSPLLLVPPCGAVPATTKTALASVTRQYVIGGPGAVCDALALALKQR